MKLYSPSSRTDFSFCPRMWYLRKQGWVLRQVPYPELCAWGGAAVSEALSLYNKARISGQTKTHDEIVAYGLQALIVQQTCAIESGRMIVGKDQEFLDTVPMLVEKAIRITLEQDPLASHTLIASEHEFKDFGNARPDIISRDANNEIVVDDYKCKFGKFDPAWMDKEFAKHFDGEQRLAYTKMAGASLFGIILIIPQPVSKGVVKKPMIVRRVTRIREQEHRQWANDAALDYEQMEQMEKKPSPLQVRGKVGPHASVYGDCLYRDACLEDDLLEDRMRVRYIKIERKE